MSVYYIEALCLLEDFLENYNECKVAIEPTIAFIAKITGTSKRNSIILVLDDAIRNFNKLFEEEEYLSEKEKLNIFKEDLDRKKEYIQFLSFYLEDKD